MKEQKPPIFRDGKIRERKYCLEYRFMHNGSRVSVYGKSEDELFKKRYDILTGEKTVSGQTFGKWMKEWHKLYDNKIINEQNKLSNEKYINDIIKALGDKPLIKVSGLDIQRFLNTYEDRKNTQGKIARKIKSALTMALNLGKIKVNPFVAVSIRKHQPIKHRPLTFDEQTLIYNNIDKKYFNLFKFCCCTGLRISEALSIKRSDIDFDNSLIYAKRLKKQGKEIIAPVPFLPELLSFEFNDKLFDLTYNGFKSYLQDFYSRSDINIKGILIHNFRSTFASNCYAAGIKDKQIQEWLCHETLAMTMDTYTHLIKNGNSPLYDYILRLKQQFNL